MKLTINQLIQAMESSKKITKEKFSLKTAYKLTRLFQEIEKEVALYEESVKSAIIKYSKKDEEGNPIVNRTESGEETVELTPENQIICMQEINDLSNSEIEIKDCYFDLEDFGNTSISMEELKGLLPFIKEE